MSSGDAAVTRVKNDTAYYDIVIVGGGMVGLALVHMLVQAIPNLRLCLLEKHLPSDAGSPDLGDSGEANPMSAKLNGTKSPGAKSDILSTALAKDSVTILKQLGLWQGLAPFANPIDKVHVSDRGHLGAMSFFASELAGAFNQQDPSVDTGERGGSQPLGYVVENLSFSQHLSQRAKTYPNLHLRAETVERLAPGKDCAHLTLADGTTLRADLVVVADGAQSALRTSLGIGVDVDDYRQHAIVTNIDLENTHQNVAYERFTADGPLALLPLKGRRCALVWTVLSDDVNERMNLSDDLFLQHLQSVFGYRLGRFRGLGERVQYPLTRKLAREQVRTSIVLMGNAAHLLHPIAGQGFNLALRDCASLARVLKAAKDDRLGFGELSVLRQYLACQQQDQWRTAFIGHNFNRIFSSGLAPVKAVRNLGLLGLELVPTLKNRLLKQMIGDVT